jgi:hypothetical protein
METFFFFFLRFSSFDGSPIKRAINDQFVLFAFGEDEMPLYLLLEMLIKLI